MSEEANGAVMGAGASVETNAGADAKGQTEQNGNAAAGTKGSQSEDGLTISFNHQQITLSKDEAARLAQLGKLYEGKESLLRAAEDDFKRSGAKTYDEYVATRKAEAEKRQVDALVADKGLDEADAKELVRLRGIERELEESRKKDGELSRLAEQLRELKEAHPEVDLNNIPPEVAAYAAKNGVPPLVAYENTVLLKKASEELAKIKQEKENAQASAGSSHSQSTASGLDDFDSQWQKGAKK